MKLHICCGSIYLKGFLNTDIWGKPPKKTNPNKTDIENYYQFPFEKDPNKRRRTEPIVDLRMDFTQNWPFKDNSADQILMVCCIEHVTKEQAKFVMSEVYRVLKKGSSVYVDFPDEAMDFYRYYDPNAIGEENDFYYELIHCNGKNAWSIHKWGYTFNSFKFLLNQIGDWSIKKSELVQHDYPMIGVEATKI